jgi:preprotein translocase subunit SecD
MKRQNMNQGLGWKLAVIVATLAVFVYGIFAIPTNWSARGLLQAVERRIHLGLDLEGGTHLVLQVQVNDAVNVDSDNALERLRADLTARKITYSQIAKPDPVNHPSEILIKGVPLEASSDLRSLVTARLPEYALTPGPENSWSVSMKPQALKSLKSRAVEEAIQTIRNRIDQLGVTEPTIEEYGLGQYQILVQLPGVEDSARVKQIMQSTAMREIRQALAGPFASEQDALQHYGGVLPPNAVLLPASSVASPQSEAGPAWYLVSSASAITGRDLRIATASQDENGQPSVQFTLANDGGRRFAEFTRSHIGDNLAVVLDNKVQEVAVIKKSDTRHRNDQRPLYRAGGKYCARERCRLASSTWRSAPWGRP